MSLKKTVSVSAIWSLTNAFFLKGSVFVVSLFLARIIGPESFGLIGMITVFIYLGNIIQESGLSESIVRTKDITDKDLSTVFYMNILMSSVIYAAFYFTAPFIADFFEQDVLVSLIRIYCLSFILNAFSAIHIALLNQQMNFKKITLISIPSYVLGSLVGIWAALNDFAVWSIVYMNLSIRFLESLFFWIFTKWTPTLTFSKKHLKVHYGFGYKLMLSGIIETIFTHIYNIVIGKYFSVIQLGYYERANSLKTYPVTTLSGIIHKVTLPLLSGLQYDKTKMTHVYRKMLRISFFIIAPTMLGFAAIATPLFNIILGDEWLEAIPIFRILCLSAIFYPVHAFNVNIFKVVGRSDIFLKTVIVKKLMVLVSVLCVVSFGIYALLWSMLVNNIIALFINTYYNKDLIEYPAKSQLYDLISTTVTTIFMALAVFYITSQLTDINNFLTIFISIFSGIIIYITLSYILNKEILLTTFKLVRR
jgi:O-antigen/teichoic acid export membrane protein